MPPTDALQPPLSEAERAICKAYGGWTSFMASMGLKPWDDEDADEGKHILATFVANDKEEKASKEAKKNNGGASGS
ncbi:hypothetical protein QQS21_003048 [Conoideocrella luteorostrata]|uniref:Extracellular metalloproteinase 3 n=1 Tax=Conoideocrella luteorostrata TaxID=1105319 RepID=A0AAJ0CUU3_9HYPO|nr:hypothetical protein QQS21_003048 [Conoideocrella luteorostrata]